MNKILTIFKLLPLALCAISVATAKPIVTASIQPTKYFIEQIAGDTIEVRSLLEANTDPHTYEPKAAQMRDVEASELYFAVGVEFEAAWLDRFKSSFKNLEIVHTDETITKIAGHHHEEEHEEHDHADHEHEEHAEHKHGEYDTHIWLDPILVKRQAINIAKALIAKYPQNAELYERNLTKFQAHLDNIHSQISMMFAGVKNRQFLIYHPSFGYFAARYDLEQLAIEQDGKEPSAKKLAEIIQNAQNSGIKTIFVSDGFSKKPAQTIADQLGAQVVEIKNLSPNWEEDLLIAADAIKKALGD